MDQFCAKKDETYRRCVCSSRLDEVKSKERVLTQTLQQLDDFKSLNIDSISKTSAEVKAMLTASEGEAAAANTKDTSNSAMQLAGISAVLTKTKAEALSTQGKLDIAGDINAIWSTTDLAGGADIMNLTGEALYNAVHAQCIEFSSLNCGGSKSTIDMVVSAYGMYIENDCTSLSNALAKQTTTMSSNVRQTEREMNIARLENYNVHNSTSINDCIAQVRKDITGNMACGPNYVHCLDITGQYLNYETGEPIYTPNFYQLEQMTSLSGDVLTNQANRILVTELNRKKEFAKRGLDTCRDLEKDVWEEFMRQAIAEIYQGQQARVRQVKNECIDVVNMCYDEQSKSLKDFSNVKEQLMIGARLELSEQMCAEKLDACSNLYGGGTIGLDELLLTMQNITEQKIAKDCKTSLEEYVLEICAVPSSDIIHGYPYACRTYAPGEQRYAFSKSCNSLFATSSGSSSGFIGGSDGDGTTTELLMCPEKKMYTSCLYGFYMFGGTGPGNSCVVCPSGCDCPGGGNDKQPVCNEESEEIGEGSCGEDYIGSLYQKVVRYAMQSCVRPSKASDSLPTVVLEDVNAVMDKVKSDMGRELSKECERLGGLWVSTIWVDIGPLDSQGQTDGTHDVTGDTLLKIFYDTTSTNTKWGYCAEK